MCCARLRSAQHVGLEQLLVGEGVVDQRAIVHHHVELLRQPLPDLRPQAQLRLGQVTCAHAAECGAENVR